MQNQTVANQISGIPLENILVVPTDELFAAGAWQGLRGVDEIDLSHYLTIIQTQGQFLPRPAMEQDVRFKQVIPYLIFRHQERYFLMQRASKASEQRLRSKFSLGIGGHVREDDLNGSSIFDWARREFAEEVNYQGNLDVQVLGILNDDSNEVGRVHVGLVLLLTGDSSQIKIKSEWQSGGLATLAECMVLAGQFESWSYLVLEYLRFKPSQISGE